jgi:hypothetical protein
VKITQEMGFVDNHGSDRGYPLPPPKKGREGAAKLTAGLLPTGSGRMTAFDYRVAWGPKTLLLIEPESEAVIRNDVRGLCEYWLAEVRGTEKPHRPLPEELERVYRGMAGLTETDDEDPVKALITPEIVEPNDLFAIVLHRSSTCPVASEPSSHMIRTSTETPIKQKSNGFAGA